MQLSTTHLTGWRGAALLVALVAGKVAFAWARTPSPEDVEAALRVRLNTEIIERATPVAGHTPAPQAAVRLAEELDALKASRIRVGEVRRRWWSLLGARSTRFYTDVTVEGPEGARALCVTVERMGTDAWVKWVDEGGC